MQISNWQDPELDCRSNHLDKKTLRMFCYSENWPTRHMDFSVPDPWRYDLCFETDPGWVFGSVPMDCGPGPSSGSRFCSLKMLTKICFLFNYFFFITYSSVQIQRISHYVKELSSETDPGEIRFIQKVFRKEKGAEVFRKLRPSPILWEHFKAPPCSCSTAPPCTAVGNSFPNCQLWNEITSVLIVELLILPPLQNA